MFGYGKILDINLSDGKIIKKDVETGFARKYIGGMGFSCKILFDEVGTDVEPLGPDNIIVYANGPLTGTQAPCAGRTEISTRSPLTGSIGTGNTGGMWGTFLKHAGYDIVIVRGRAEKPVYIWIDDDKIELRQAGHVWGKDARQTSAILKNELDSVQPTRISVLAIGQAGENLVKFACPLNDDHHVAGRGGIGAVMGSKNLKAIAVRGTGTVSLARPEEFKEAVREARERIKKAQDAAGFLGPRDRRTIEVEHGCIPGKNYQTGVLPDWLETHGREVAAKYVTKKEGTCYACPMSCFTLAEVNEGKYAGLKVNRATGPGVAFDWGAKCAIDNMPGVWQCKEICQQYGLDYASAAGVIAFAMELFQRGIITTHETDGLEVTWGNEDVAIKLLYKIISREGFGNILAEGSVRAAAIIGKGSEKYVMTTKGVEMMSEDPRSCRRGWSFGEMTNPRGGDNVKGTHFFADWYNSNWWADDFDIFPEVKAKMYNMPPEDVALAWEGKPVMTKWFEDLYSALNAFGVCFFPAGFALALGPTHFSRIYSACTGLDTSPQEIMEIGEKTFTLLKAYAIKMGMTRKDDRWPDRFFDEPQAAGPSKGAILSWDRINKLLDEYYDLRGWDKKTSFPTEKKLIEIGLPDIADGLKKAEKLQSIS